MAVIIPDLFGSYIAGRRTAEQDNWTDIDNYNNAIKKQIDNQFAQDTYSAKVADTNNKAYINYLDYGVRERGQQGQLDYADMINSRYDWVSKHPFASWTPWNTSDATSFATKAKQRYGGGSGSLGGNLDLLGSLYPTENTVAQQINNGDWHPKLGADVAINETPTPVKTYNFYNNADAGSKEAVVNNTVRNVRSALVDYAKNTDWGTRNMNLEDIKQIMANAGVTEDSAEYQAVLRDTIAYANQMGLTKSIHGGDGGLNYGGY